jgi:vitamin B12 transporter
VQKLSIRGIGACLAVWLIVARAHAQEPLDGADGGVSEAPPARMGLVPPVLLEAAAPQLPEAHAPVAQPQKVVTQLEVDVAGRVAACSVKESLDHTLDAAACEAAQRYHFEPATRDGVPIAARIALAIVFESAPSGTTEPTLPPTAATLRAAPVVVSVQGQQRESQRLAQSSEAVTVQDMSSARRESASTGEVLARLPGVAVRRAGGLGSEETLSLVGLSDLAILVDGVAMRFGSFQLGVSSFPVNLIDRLEIYTGVVPLRFGAAALGGAINIVTRRHREAYANLSLEQSSFGTTRLTGGGGYRHEQTGLVMNATGFYDHADNDYPITVNIPDDFGMVGPARVRRFHDGYRAYGGTLELGIVDKPWARALFVGAFLDSTEREIQSNPTATIPYGEAVKRSDPWGFNARYGVDVSRVHIDANVAYTHERQRYQNPMNWVYNWRGQRVASRPEPPGAMPKGEDTEIWYRSLLGRLTARYDLAAGHTLTASSTQTYTQFSGDNKKIQDDGDDPWERVDRLSENKQRLAGTRGVATSGNRTHPCPCRARRR